VQQVVAKCRDASACRFRRLVLDLVLELVDLLVERVDEVEVALRDLSTSRYAIIPAESVGLTVFLTMSTSHAARLPCGVLRTVSSVSCVMMRSISW